MRATTVMPSPWDGHVRWVLLRAFRCAKQKSGSRPSFGDEAGASQCPAGRGAGCDPVISLSSPRWVYQGRRSGGGAFAEGSAAEVGALEGRGR